ncbi:phosphatase 2C [Tieghemiomyces parasiticus]|uniref:Phosphatase 2C n=1 Tax=Tieghemiomyces parasiticus TaxID=78921 RepID=A0A9W8AJU4_9FUNG|nr:phosphatase 2C [Tieghemiomyces parasiticus]
MAEEPPATPRTAVPVEFSQSDEPAHSTGPTGNQGSSAIPPPSTASPVNGSTPQSPAATATSPVRSPTNAQDGGSPSATLAVPSDSIKTLLRKPSASLVRASIPPPINTTTAATPSPLVHAIVPSPAPPVGLCDEAPDNTGQPGTFRVGVASDRNRRCRRTMEDSHSFFYKFDDADGQGFFTIFDGHAGKQAAEWCGLHFHEIFLANLARRRALQHASTPKIDTTSTPSTADVVAAVSAIPSSPSRSANATATLPTPAATDVPQTPLPLVSHNRSLSLDSDDLPSVAETRGPARPSPSKAAEVAASALRPITAESTVTELMHHAFVEADRRISTELTSHSGCTAVVIFLETHPASASLHPATTTPHTWSLYSGNAGDARGVLARGGRAVRLTYDHKGDDPHEVRRISEAGGFVLNNRVNGVLAVTRALGDSSMKDVVVGHPYTTETDLNHEDTFLILACDGLWDVCTDQEAVDLVKDEPDPQKASEQLTKHALDNFSRDNITVMVVRLYH